MAGFGRYKKQFSVGNILDNVSEADKLKEPYLKGNVDYCLAQLVYDKFQIRDAYNMYFGERDYAEYQHLSDNYGLGTSTKIPHLRLMGTKIDYMVGKAMQNTFDYYVTCANAEAINLKMTEKRNNILGKLEEEINQRLSLINQSKPEEAEKKLTSQFLEKLKLEYNDSWQSSFETAAQDAVTRLIDELELQLNFSEHMKDLLIAGETFNRSFVKEIGTDPGYWRCDPRDTYFEPNPDSDWVEDCKRITYRRQMHPTQVIHELGHLMTDQDKNDVAEALRGYYVNKYSTESTFTENFEGEDVPLSSPDGKYQADLIDVYHCEWIASNPVEDSTDTVDNVESKDKNIRNKRERKDRYEGTYIDVGTGIYVGLGRSKYMERSKSKPLDCKLTYNGVILKKDRVGNRHLTSGNTLFRQPYSFILATKDISDMYDIVHMQSIQLFSVARPGGVYVPIESLPEYFGKDTTERLMKVAGFQKAFSVLPISLSQEGNTVGEAGSIPFNNYGSYPSNVDSGLFQAYQAFLAFLNTSADNMLGLNPRMKGEMEERDGKATTLNAVQQGELFTKQIFRIHSAFIRKTLTKIINQTRISYKDGFIGSIVLGNKSKIFSIDPHTHSMSDYNVYISDDIEEKQEQAKVDGLLQTAIQSQLVDFKTAFETLTSRSISGKKAAIMKAQIEKEESAITQVEELNQQMEELNKKNEDLEKKIKQLDEDKLSIDKGELEVEKKKVEGELKIKQLQLELEERKMNLNAEIKKSETELHYKTELAQLADSNKKNDKIKDK